MVTGKRKMNAVKVRNVVIGEGMPKICVPVTGTDREQILEEAAEAAGLGADIVELRADWFENLSDPDRFSSLLIGLRETLGDTPLLLTVRTAEEGGEIDITEEDYAEINIRAIRSGSVDMVDAEVFKGEGISGRIISEAHAAGVKVVASYHDFAMTPEKSEIVNRLRRMQETGADIIKIAVMPQSSKDVITLLDAAQEMTANYAICPVIAISMAEQGMVSRLACEAFGTAMTFGAAQRASAPGQLCVEELRQGLAVFHRALKG